MLAQAKLLDCLLISWKMREADKKEVWAFSRQLPLQALLTSYHMSREYRKTFWHQGEPVAMLGLATASGNPVVGVPWMLATSSLTECSLAFGKASRLAHRESLSIRPAHLNFVYAMNTQSIGWLEWLGYTVEEPIISIGEDEDRMFRRFTYGMEDGFK